MIIEATGFDHNPLTGKQQLLHDAGVSSIHTTFQKQSLCASTQQKDTPSAHTRTIRYRTCSMALRSGQWMLAEGTGLHLPGAGGNLRHGLQRDQNKLASFHSKSSGIKMTHCSQECMLLSVCLLLLQAWEMQLAGHFLPRQGG
jgi:hypothetical protein